MALNGNKVYQFDGFRLDERERLLFNGGERIQINDKAFDLLCVLVDRNGKLVTKEELLSEVWPDSFVEENTLDKNVSLLRRVLDEKDREQKLIETVRGHGYRFSAELEFVERELEDIRQVSGNDLEAESPTSDLNPLTLQPTGETLKRPDGLAMPKDAAWHAEPQVQRGRLRRAMTWTAVGFGALGLFAAVYFTAFYHSQAPVSSPTGPRRIAVLPLLNRTGDSNAEYLSDGITEGIIDDLARVSGLKVSSRNSVFRFKDDQADLRKIGEQLGVDFIATGEIKKIEGQMVINVRLTELSDNSQLWGNQYVRGASDILGIQSEITRDVAKGLRVKLDSSEDQDVARSHTENAEAYRTYLLGRYHVRKATEDEIVLGVEFFKKALAEDPHLAAAWVGIADAYRVFAIAGWHITSRDAWRQSRDAAKQALAIDPDLAGAHSALAWALYMDDRDLPGAEREFRRALEIAPDNGDIHRGLAHTLSLAGRHDEAIAEGKRSVELDPLSLIDNALYGQFLFYSGQTEAAIEQVKKTFAIEPNFWIAHNLFGRILLAQGKFKDALEEFRKAREFSGGDSIVPITEIGYTYAKMGDQGAALAEIRDLKKENETRPVPYYSFALIYNGLGDRASALEYLTKSIEEHESYSAFIKASHRWDSYKGEPRFDDLMRQMHFE